MAYVLINQSEVEAGKAGTTDIFSRLVSSSAAHELRINLLEAGSGKVRVWNDFVHNSSLYTINSTVTGLDYYKVDRGFTLLSAVLSNITAGTSGILEIDVLRSTTGIDGAYTSVFNVLPSLSFSAGDNVSSSNADFATTVLSVGDWLRLDITSFQVPQADFHFSLTGEVT